METEEKNYVVGGMTKRILDCKRINDNVYSEIMSIVEEFYSSNAEKIVERTYLLHIPR